MLRATLAFVVGVALCAALVRGGHTDTDADAAASATVAAAVTLDDAQLDAQATAEADAEVEQELAVEMERDGAAADADAEADADTDAQANGDDEGEGEGEAEAEAEAEVEIRYCAACGYHDRFLQIKTEVERRFPGAVVKGVPSSQRMDGKEFDITVNGEVISERAVVVTNDVMVEHILGYLRRDDWEPWKNWEQDHTQHPIV